MKSPIRKEIEKILGFETFNNPVYVDCCNPKSTKTKRYRMKFVTYHLLSLQNHAKIMKLPHVIRAGWYGGQHKYKGQPDGMYAGIVIYFDCKPSTIKL